MRRRVTALGAVVLVTGPPALAFFDGGYFTQPRLVAGIVAWLLVLALALAGSSPLPATRAGWAAVAGLTLLAAWTALSILWAPVSGPVVADAERVALYLGALLAAIGVLRSPRVAAAAEPLAALGVFVVIAYGLAGRLLPDVVDVGRSLSAGGRLDQPLTYWNAEGMLAAIGFVLCVRVAGSPHRRRSTRVAAAAGAPALAAALYLTLSRGAVASAAVGLVVLLALSPTWPQLRATRNGLLTAGGAVASVATLSTATLAPRGDANAVTKGAVALVLLLAISALAALLAVRAVERDRLGVDLHKAVPFAPRLPAAVAAILCLVVAGLAVGSLDEPAGAAPRTARLSGPSRLVSIHSNRYEYWQVAARAFAEHPLGGLGAGGFRVAWLRERPIEETVRDVHSLELEAASELGIVGVLGLGLLAGGIAAAARSAVRGRRDVAVGALAVGVVWALQSSIDWMWQMPAATLPALVFAAGLIVAGERSDAVLAGHVDAQRPGSDARRDGRAHVAAPGPRAGALIEQPMAGAAAGGRANGALAPSQRAASERAPVGAVHARGTESRSQPHGPQATASLRESDGGSGSEVPRWSDDRGVAPRAPSSSIAARVVVTLIAVALASWMGMMLRNDRIGTAAANAYLQDPEHIDFGRFLHDLERAKVLDPSTDWPLARARFLLVRDRPAAQRLAQEVVDREPENYAAWTVVLLASRGRDPAEAAIATRRIRQLNPAARLTS